MIKEEQLVKHRFMIFNQRYLGIISGAAVAIGCVQCSLTSYQDDQGQSGEST